MLSLLLSLAACAGAGCGRLRVWRRGMVGLWDDARVSWSSLSVSSSSEEGGGGGASAGTDLGRKYLVMSFIGVGVLSRCFLAVPLMYVEGLIRMLEWLEDWFLVGIVSPVLSRGGDLEELSAEALAMARELALLEWDSDTLALFKVAVYGGFVPSVVRSIVFEVVCAVVLLGEWSGRVS